jgi:hypothetical protein
LAPFVVVAFVVARFVRWVRKGGLLSG